MTLIASLLFLSALAASAFAIAHTFGNAMPRIREVIDTEFGPQVLRERKISFGPVRHSRKLATAEILPFPRQALITRDFKLAA